MNRTIHVPSKRQVLACSFLEGTSEQKGHFAGQHEDEKLEYHRQKCLLREKYHLFLEVHNPEQHHFDDNRWPAQAHLPLHCQAKHRAKSME